MGKRLPKGWRMAGLGEVLDYEQPTKYIVSSIDYDDRYETPVLTAGKTFILGYTNEQSGIFREKLPVIIFDDFTTTTKFVDFPFKVKSSAMKILHADKNKADIKFLFHAMQKIVFPVKEHKRYWISEYSKNQIPLPPLPTQKRIVEILGEADSLRKLRRQADEKMQDLVPSLFVEMFGDPATNPKGWRMVSLREVCKKPEYGYTASAENTCVGPKFLRITDIQKGDVDWSNVPFCECSDKDKLKYLLNAGDIAVARIGATTGKAFLVKECTDAVFASYLIRLRTNNNLLPEYLFAFMNTKFYWFQINSAKGSRLKHGVNIPVLSSLKLPLPPLPLQQEFAARVGEIEAEKARQTESRKKLDELFNSLMQRAFTGELMA